MRGCRERISRQTDKLKSRQTINRMRVYNYFKGPFFICYLAASLPTLGQYLGDNLNQCQSQCQASFNPKVTKRLTMRLGP